MTPKLYTDGACRGNPGKGACAWALVNGSDVLFQQLNSLTITKRYSNE